MSNRLRARWQAGEVSFGGWCATPSSFNAELYAHEGFDYVCVDCQHGLVGFDAMWPMLAALRFADATPIVRVPYNETPLIGRALDAGASAVIVPMVESRTDAHRAAAACRYAPEGVRSYGPTRARMLLGNDPPAANREVMCLVMVETVSGVEHLDEICSTPGVDGVYVGPSDLAVSLGIPLADAFVDDSHLAAIRRIREACRDAGLLAGIHTPNGTVARRMADDGFDMCTVGTDAALLQAVLRAELGAARGASS